MSLINYDKERQEADTSAKVAEPATDKQPAIKAGDTEALDRQRMISALPEKADERGVLFIPGNQGRVHGSARPPQGRRLIINVGAIILLLVVVIGVLAAVIPAGLDGKGGLSTLFQSAVGQKNVAKNDSALIAAQAATATAVTKDGFEFNGAGGNQQWPGVQSNFTLPDGTNSKDIPTGPVQTAGGGISSPVTGTIADSSYYNPFTAGNCTYWADYRYHQLTGYTIPWSGYAAQWAANAAATPGWIVSDQPHVPSIIVLQGGVQGAGYGTGHVAVVESINADHSVETSNWNVVGWGVYSEGKYWPGNGVKFVWHQ